jgi:hypothetical protein
MKQSELEALRREDPYGNEIAERCQRRFRSMSHIPVLSLPRARFDGIACLAMSLKEDEYAVGYVEESYDKEVRQVVLLQRELIDRYGADLIDSLLKHELFHSEKLPSTPAGSFIETAALRGIVNKSEKSFLQHEDMHWISNVLEDMLADWGEKAKRNAPYVQMLKELVKKDKKFGYPMNLVFWVRCHRNMGPDAAETRQLLESIQAVRFPLNDLTGLLGSTEKWQSHIDFLRAYCRLAKLIVSHWPDPKQGSLPQSEKRRGVDQGEGSGSGGNMPGQPERGSGGRDAGGGKGKEEGQGGGGEDGAETRQDRAGAAGKLVMSGTESDIAKALKDLLDGIEGKILKDESVEPDPRGIVDSLLGQLGGKGVSTKGDGLPLELSARRLIEILSDRELLGILFPSEEGNEHFGSILPLRVPPRENYRWGKDRMGEMDPAATIKRFGPGRSSLVTQMKKRTVLPLEIPVIPERANTPPVFMIIDTSGSMSHNDILQAIAIGQKTADQLYAPFGLVLFHTRAYFSQYWETAMDASLLGIVGKIRSGGTRLAQGLLRAIVQAGELLGSDVTAEKRLGYALICSDFALDPNDRMAYQSMCLNHPVLSSMRQVHISVAQMPAQMPPPHVTVVAKSFKQGAIEARDFLLGTRFERSFGMNRY